MGLEVLVDHGSTDVQDSRVEQLWYNGKFYNNPEELAQKYADGEVDMVVSKTHAQEHRAVSTVCCLPPMLNSSCPSEGWPSGSPAQCPSFNLRHDPVFRGHWSFSFLLCKGQSSFFQPQPSCELQIFNVLCRGENIT